MLTALRSFAKTKAALVVFGVLILALGIGVGMSDPFSGITGGGLIQAGDRSASAVDVDRIVEARLREIREESGEFLTAQDAAEQGITNQALAELRQRIAIMAYADKIGVRASVAAVTNLLEDAPRFRDAFGRIDLEQVRNYATEQGFRSVRDFESDLRDQLTLDYIVRAAFAGIETPDILVQPFVSYAGERRTVSVARLTEASITTPPPPTEEELTTFYEEQRALFGVPELRRIIALTYSPDDFLDKVDVGDDLLRSEYERRIREFSTPEHRSIIEFSSSNRNDVQAVVDALQAGRSVEQIRTSAANVAFNSREVRQSEIEDQDYSQLVFAIAPGESYGPVQLDGQWRGVFIENSTPGVATAFEYVADGLRTEMARREAERLFRNTYELFFDLVGGGAPLEDLAQELGVPLIELPPVDSRGATIAGTRPTILSRHPEALRTMFSLSAGDMSDVIEREEERLLLRLEAIVPARTRTLDEVRGDLGEIYIFAKMQEAAQKTAEALVVAIKEGGDFARAAAAARMAYIQIPDITRGVQGMFDPAVLGGIFALDIGETAAIQDSRGEPWVVRVEASNPVDEETRIALTEGTRGEVAALISRDLENIFLRKVLATVKVRTNDGAIQRYLDRFKRTDS